MHITVAIPTFNRVEKLKRCVESISSQSLDNDIQLSIAISNTASSDDTYSYLSNLKGLGDRFVITNEIGADTQRNLGSLAKTIPSTSDWVWLMGDDDYLSSPHSVSIVHEIISSASDADLSFVHACQTRRSARSEKMFENDVLSLCEEFGFHEMLGWFSSIVSRREIMVSALQNTQDRFQSGGVDTSAFTHSAEFLKLMHDKSGIFVDYPLVEPQDDEMTAETVHRWLNENIGERYFYVIDDIIRLRDEGVFTERLTSKFFRYHTYGLWDRLITHQLNTLMGFKAISSEPKRHEFLQTLAANWDRIGTLCELVKEPQVRKYLNMCMHNAMNISMKFLNGELSQRDLEDAAREQMMMFNAPAYEFNVLQQRDELVSAA
jgi:glycosyltransferase involved in cell wall biosynthesis